MVDCLLAIREHEVVLRILTLIERSDGFLIGVGEGDATLRMDDCHLYITRCLLVEAGDDPRDGVLVGFRVDALLLQGVPITLIYFEIGG